jgi:hypothetical protein
MFKLLRLAIYAIVGYAVYHFVMDVVETSGERQGSQGGRRGGGQGRGTRSGGGQQQRLSGARRGGGGGGKAEVTADSDGGSTRHRVGRGVV